MMVPGAMPVSVAAGFSTRTRPVSGFVGGPKATMYPVTPFSGLGAHDSFTVPWLKPSTVTFFTRAGLDASSISEAAVVLATSVTSW